VSHHLNGKAVYQGKHWPIDPEGRAFQHIDTAGVLEV
jgi:hypothetical protein